MTNPNDETGMATELRNELRLGPEIALALQRYCAAREINLLMKIATPYLDGVNTEHARGELAAVRKILALSKPEPKVERAEAGYAGYGPDLG